MCERSVRISVIYTMEGPPVRIGLQVLPSILLFVILLIHAVDKSDYLLGDVGLSLDYRVNLTIIILSKICHWSLFFLSVCKLTLPLWLLFLFIIILMSNHTSFTCAIDWMGAIIAQTWNTTGRSFYVITIFFRQLRQSSVTSEVERIYFSLVSFFVYIFKGNWFNFSCMWW